MSHGGSADGDFRILPDGAAYLRRRLLGEAVRRIGSASELTLAVSSHRGVGGCFVASEPLVAVGGCEFRYTPSIQDVLEQDVDAIATDMRRALEAFHTARRSLGPQVVAARKLAEWVIERGAIAGSTPIVIGVEMHTAGIPMLVVDTIGLRDDLLVGRIEAAGSGLADLNIHLLAQSARQRHRGRLLAQAEATGAAAWMDGFALHVIDRCGLCPSILTRILDADEELEMEMGSGDDALVASFLWTDGVLGVAFPGRGMEFEFHRGALTINCAGVPDTALALLPGRPLRSLIEHPLLPREAPILDVRDLGGEWKVVTVESELHPLVGDDRVPHRR